MHFIRFVNSSFSLKVTTLRLHSIPRRYISFLRGAASFQSQVCEKRRLKNLRSRIWWLKRRVQSIQAMNGNLWPRIVEAYEEASRVGAAFKTPTQVEVITDSSSHLPFVLRVSESLQAKPSTKQEGGEVKKKKNPFLPYDEALWVMHLSDSHTMLLNKFNLLDRHVLVVTREFESQDDPLTLADISATWTTIKSMPKGGLAFFNCGPMSGASQPHKHTQVVPLPLSNSLPLPLDDLYKSLVSKEAARLKPLPFLAVGVSLDGQEEDSHLLESYQALLRLANASLASQMGSYNIVWTQDWMILIPRSQAGSGPCNLNSLGFAGTLFVRTEEEVQYVKQMGPMKLLELVTYPNPAPT